MKAINVICKEEVTLRDKNLSCIAVDSGLLYAIKNNLEIIKVIGDFDSIDNKEYLNYQDRLLLADKDKDESDFALALSTLSDFQGTIYVYGALGKRMDHTLVNLKLCYYSMLDIHLIDERNEIYRLNPGIYKLQKGPYRYISFLGFEDCHLTLLDFKFNSSVKIYTLHKF